MDDEGEAEEDDNDDEEDDIDKIVQEEKKKREEERKEKATDHEDVAQLLRNIEQLTAQAKQTSLGEQAGSLANRAMGAMGGIRKDDLGGLVGGIRSAASKKRDFLR